MTDFDVLLIGTGSGNTIIDEHFDGQRIAIAEEWHFGGTCLNVGCIPTKMLVRPADLAAEIAHSAHLNVDATFTSADWPALRDRVFSRIDGIEADGRDYRTNRLENVTVFPEHVSFTGAHTFTTATGQEFSAQRIVIATGATPTIPKAAGLDPTQIDSPACPVHTSNSIMRVESLPQSLVIVGSGYVAVEFAHIFAALGCEVTLVTRGPRLLGSLDGEVSAAFTEEFAATHTVLTGLELAAVDTSHDGVSVRLTPTGRTEAAVETSVSAERLLIATGREPNVAGLNPEAAAIDLTSDGRISVDAYQRVLSDDDPLPGVFALGDVSSPFQLKHVANHEARVVKHNLLADIASGTVGGAITEDLQEVNHFAVPAAVFSRPQIATVGETEEELRNREAAFVSHTHFYGATAYGWALNDETSFVKVLAEAHSHQILGAHIMGPEASMIIQPLIQAMSFGQRTEDVAQHQYWIHPALTEVVENALLGLEYSDDQA